MICRMEGTLSDLQSQVLVSQPGQKKCFVLQTKILRVAMYTEHPNAIFYAVSYEHKMFLQCTCSKNTFRILF